MYSQDELDEAVQNANNDGGGSGINWLLIIVLIWLIFFHKQKYEGLTAEEWFNRYDSAEERYEQFHSCVEEYAYSSDYNDLKEIYYQCL